MSSSCSDETTPNPPRMADRHRVTVVQHAQSRAIVVPSFGSGGPRYDDDGTEDVGSWFASALAERHRPSGPHSYGSFARRNHYVKLVGHLQRGEHEVFHGIPGRVVCCCGLIGRDELDLLASPHHREIARSLVSGTRVVELTWLAEDAPERYCVACVDCGCVSPAMTLDRTPSWQASHSADQAEPTPRDATVPSPFWGRDDPAGEPPPPQPSAG